VRELYNSAFFEEAEKFLATASQSFPDAKDRYARRVEFLRVGLEYSRLAIDLMEVAELKKAKKEIAAEVLAEVEAKKKRIAQINKEYPFAMQLLPEFR